jgi:hypothetical protein
MSFPAGVLLPVFLLGVIAVDLTFDIGGLPPATTATYYAGLKSASFPSNSFVLAAIVLGSIPYLIAMKRPTLVDYISLIVLGVCLVVFVGYLIPSLVRYFVVLVADFRRRRFACECTYTNPCF